MGKIPDHAKKVFEGVLYDVYHWDQELFDGSSTTFEHVRRIGSVQLICLNEEGELILLDEEQPFWGSDIGMVGGQIERGQTPDEAARRELLEELGMECSSLEIYEEFNIGFIDWPVYYYICRECKQVQEPHLDPGEKLTPLFLSFDEFIEKTQDERFRNKHFANTIFRMIHTQGELDKFKKILFD